MYLTNLIDYIILIIKQKGSDAVDFNLSDSSEIPLGIKEDFHCFKMGKGKPYGFGSVKIRTKKLIFRKLGWVDGRLIHKMSEAADLDAYYAEAFIKPNEKKHLAELLTISDFNINLFFNGKKAYVCYPEVIKDDKPMEEGYHWFQDNRSIHVEGDRYSYKSMGLEVFETLPELTKKKDSIYVPNVNMNLYKNIWFSRYN